MTVTGNVLFRERIAVPPGAIATIKLVDTDGEVLAATAVDAPGVPVEFSVTVDSEFVPDPANLLIWAILRIRGRRVGHHRARTRRGRRHRGHADEDRRRLMPGGGGGGRGGGGGTGITHIPQEEIKAGNNRPILSRIARMLRPYRGKIILVAIAVVVSAILTSIVPFLTKAVFDKALFPPSANPTSPCCGGCSASCA